MKGVDSIRGAVLTIGNFDGLHLGHKKLISALIRQARLAGRPSALYTFSPHPVSVLFPEKEHRLLCSPDKNRKMLRSAGVERLLIQPFTKAFSRLSPEEFMQKHILSLIQPSVIVVGYNFRFGAKSAGSVSLLKILMKKHGFRLKVVPPVKRRGRLVSTSFIKRAVLKGDCLLARDLLGRFFSVKGLVVKGEGRGKGLGFPTLNLKTDNQILLPADGVYTARVIKKGKYFPAVVNIGRRPTFSDNCLKTIEVHLIGEKQANWKICEVEFVRYIRKERRFAHPGDLSRQIRRDIQQARRYL